MDLAAVRARVGATEKERHKQEVLSQLPHGMPYMPKAPDFSSVFSLPADLFCVRPLELMRKATDELTLALHWYVLYTMVHSAASAQLPIAMPGKAKKPIFFLIRKPYKVIDGRTIKDSMPRTKAITHLDAEGLYADMWDYHYDQNDGNTRDFRQLIRHIKNIKARPHYYKFGAAEVYSEIIRLATNVAYHRNYVVPTDSLDEAELTLSQINARSMEIVKLFFEFLKKLLKYILYDQQADGVPRELTKQMPPHVQAACAQSLEAATVHFEGVLRISKVYEYLFVSADPDSTISPSDLLQYLKRKMASPNQQTTTQSTFFSMFALWTRFGSRLGGKAAEEEDLGVAEDVEGAGDVDDAADDAFPDMVARQESGSGQDLKSLSRVHVWRHRMPSETYMGIISFVTKDAQFGIDPCGVTHLDMLNRAVDVAGLSLRHILIQVVDAVVPLVLGGFDATPFHNTVADHLLSLNDGGISVMVPDAKLGLKFFTEMFKDDDADGGDVLSVDLVDNFCQQHGLSSDDINSLKLFVRFSPHFADPRFVAKFFQGVLARSAPLRHLSSAAQNLVDIIGRASHQKYLVKDIRLPLSQLKENIDDIVAFVKELSREADAPLGVYGDAFDELTHVVLPWYCRWRGRQYYIMRKRDGAVTEKAAETLDGLIGSIQGNALPLVKSSDNSTAALLHVLRPITIMCARSRAKAALHEAHTAKAVRAALAAAVPTSPLPTEVEAVTDDENDDALDDMFFATHMMSMRQ